MAFRGRKVADIYAELHLDQDGARATLRGVPAAMGADADRAGRELGKKVTDGLARAVEAGAARIAKARRAEVEAAKAVTVAELRLKEAREKGGKPASALLALENALEKAQYRLAESNKAATTAVTKHADAERRLASSLADVAKNVGPDAERGGQELGSKLSQGIHLSIVRNSPLIAAAIGAGLLAGAPVALAGATALFSGIGIVAAAQSEKVQSAWVDTWRHIKVSAVADAGVIEPVLVRVADNVGASFDRMRPRVQDAFSASAPQIEVFTDGILGLAENALPGLVRAVERGMPVTEGFADFLEKTGTGLTGFFDNMSEHAPAAGQAFSLIGDAIGELLPTVGTLLGQGAELATIVLPPLVSVLSSINDVVSGLGPALPLVTAGLTGWKIASVVGDGIGRLGDKVTGLAASSPRAASALGRMGEGLSALNSTAGTAGLTGILAGLVIGFQRVDEVSSQWADSIRSGGDAAVTARAQMSNFAIAQGEVTSGWGALIPLFSGAAGTIGTTTAAIGETNDKLREQWEAMDPLAQAQSKVAEWTATLATRMRDEGAASDGVAAAKRRLAHWQQESARLAREEAEAIHGSAIAMADAVTAADNLMSSLDAMNTPVLSLRDAQREYQSAIDDVAASIEENGRTLDINTEAGRANAEALDNMASSAMQTAEWIYKTTGNYDDFRANLEGARGDLLEQAIAFGMSEEAAHTYVNEVLGIPSEWRTVADFDTSTARGEVAGIIDYLKQQEPNATINLGVISEDAFNMLAEMGIKVEALPDGTVKVTLTDEVTGKLDDIDAREVSPTIDADDQPLNDKVGKGHRALNEIDGYWAAATLDADDTYIKSKTAGALAGLQNLAAQRPTPTSQLNDAPFAGTVAKGFRTIADFDARRPTPIANLSYGPFAAASSWVGGVLNALNIRHVLPKATLVAQVSTAESLLNWAARNRTSTVTQYVRNVSTVATGGPIRAAVGRKVVGAGGPTDDLVPAVGPGGADYRLSAGEWIVNAMASSLNGDTKMRALNEGRADIVLRDRPARAMAAGGPAATSLTSRAGAASITVETLNVNFPGTSFDIRDRREARRFAEWVRDEIVALEKAER